MPTKTAPHARRLALPAVVAVLCLWYLGQRVEIGALGLAFRAIGDNSALDWLGALTATAVSFWAVGRYDAVAHRHIGTGIPSPAASRAGVCGIAFSQAVGFGLLTGSFARWRLLPGLGAVTAVRVTVFVAVSFLTALAMLIGLVTLFVRPWPALDLLPVAGLLAIPAIVLLAFFRPILQFGRYRLTLPTLPALGAIGFWTVVDTAAAAMALAMLLPEPAEIGWTVVFPAYLVALAASLISGTPGGVGPLELTLVLLLPHAAAPDVIAGVMAFRLVYVVFPALLAGAVLLRSPVKCAGAVRSGAGAADLPADRARAETAVVRQPGGQILSDGDVSVAAIVTPQAVAGLFDPLSGQVAAALDLLAREARARNRIACLYKCNGRSAAAARRAGWAVQRIAREAVIRPGTFVASGPEFRQLRRKLRHAGKAGVDGERAGPVLPCIELAEVDAAWQSSRGRARGTTMGRFSRGHLDGQEVFVARTGGDIVAFATFHVSRREWCLDLMRWRPGVADGTMHLLIERAIAAAAASGIARLSLAAVPDHVLSRSGGAGLAQFKASFAPRWEPLYLAAPDAPALTLAAADIARAVRWPGPIGRKSQGIHQEDEQNGFAMSVRP